MAKCLLNRFGTLLFPAALVAAATPALTQDTPDIQQGETCQQKVGWRSWHLCGAVPADGHITYTNVGIHGVTVFTTASDGIQCEPPTDEFPTAEVLEACGALQVQENLAVNGSSQTDVETGQLVYIGRADNSFSSRTIAINFTAVPPNADLGDAIPFSETRIFIEYNATTEEAGIRAFLDGEPWDSGRIIGPDQRIFQASGGGSLRELGLTELAFETDAPTLEELLALLPEGEYEFRGRSVEGDKLLGTASLTHDIPDGPRILTPEEGAVVDPEDTVISWDPVTEPAGIEIAGYRVIVERGDRGRTLSLDLPPETTNVLVPPDFLELGTDYLFKVLAIEVGGNQTITEGVFDTAEAGDILAEPIAVGEVCQKKLFVNSAFLCGTAPGMGSLVFTNVSTHLVAVFTIAKGTNTSGWDGSVNGADNFARDLIENIASNAQATIPLVTDDRVYIGRSDHTLSNRTVGVRFDQVP